MSQPPADSIGRIGEGGPQMSNVYDEQLRLVMERVLSNKYTAHCWDNTYVEESTPRFLETCDRRDVVCFSSRKPTHVSHDGEVIQFVFELDPAPQWLSSEHERISCPATLSTQM